MPTEDKKQEELDLPNLGDAVWSNHHAGVHWDFQLGDGRTFRLVESYDGEFEIIPFTVVSSGA